ncbi:MAG TPA: dNTP triphosphohydrolase [Thermoanaerobaculia bacterium]|jgi:dGTPase|nr:dNTP triphosphohydrolase [Thermoanaerobaculia bacterium]
MRSARFHAAGPENEYRNAFQRDRDRILYSSAFRRLAGVTQVVGASEGFIFHNRLTHSLKVAQLGRRIVEKLLFEQAELAKSAVPIDPDVVEAGGLAHDLGHPPFGHVAESALKQAASGVSDFEAFEGNPQSFRIVTKLAMRSFEQDGLNLTRATLNTVLKYPWLWEAAGDRSEKWGAYHSERDVFDWARREDTITKDVKTAEAEIMDWADDIAYSVHDVEDFFKANLIPLDRLAVSDAEQTRFFDRAKDHIKIVRDGKKRKLTEAEQKNLFKRLQEEIAPLFPRERFEGTRSQRAVLRTFTSALIGRYIDAIQLREPSTSSPRSVEIDPEIEQEVNLLKELTWVYVIRNPALAAQQRGQKQLIKFLFTAFREAAEAKEPDVLPLSTRDQLLKLRAEGLETDSTRTRLVVDLIASMTEVQALETYQKLTGLMPGSGLDLLLHQSIS